MERDFGFVHHFYVDSNLLVGELLRNMLNDSLKLVEREVDEVRQANRQSWNVSFTPTHAGV